MNELRAKLGKSSVPRRISECDAPQGVLSKRKSKRKFVNEFLLHHFFRFHPVDFYSSSFHASEPCHLSFGKLMDGNFQLRKHFFKSELTDDVKSEIFVL